MDKKILKEQKNIQAFATRRMIVNILIYVALFCSAFVFTSRLIQGVSLTGLGNTVEVGIALGIFTGAIIGVFVYWRCPNCKKFIGIKPKPKTCPNCGVKLLDVK